MVCSCSPAARRLIVRPCLRLRSSVRPEPLPVDGYWGRGYVPGTPHGEKDPVSQEAQLAQAFSNFQQRLFATAVVFGLFSFLFEFCFLFCFLLLPLRFTQNKRHKTEDNSAAAKRRWLGPNQKTMAEFVQIADLANSHRSHAVAEEELQNAEFGFEGAAVGQRRTRYFRSV